MTAVGPGAPLICVDATRGEVIGFGLSPPLTLNALYFVQEVLREYTPICPRDNCGHTFFLLHGRPHTGYCPNRFRPLNDGSTDLVDVHQEIYDMIVQGEPVG